MGYDVQVYSPNDQVVDRAQLVEKMREKGWDILFITDWETMSVVSSGEVNEETVMGWRSNPELTRKIQDLVERREEAGIDELYEQGSVGVCGLNLSGCRSEEEIAELCEPNEIRADYLEAMRNARTAYWLRVVMRASRMSFELQEALWYALGEVSEGLLEDLQSDYPWFFSSEGPPNPVSASASPQTRFPVPGCIIGFAVMAVLLWLLRR